MYVNLHGFKLGLMTFIDNGEFIIDVNTAV